MAPYFRLVAYAAESNADELPSQSPRDRLAERGLADSRRTDEQQDGSGGVVDRLLFFVGLVVETAIAAQLPYCQVLDDAVFDVLETGVVGVEDLPGRPEIETILRLAAPRDLEHGFQPRPYPPVFRALLAGSLEAVDLALDALGSGRWHGGGLELLAVVGGTVRGSFAELSPDGFELLPQQVFPLGLVDSLGGVFTDPTADRNFRQHLVHPGKNLFEPVPHSEGLEDLHLLRQGEIGRIHGEVG